MRIGFEIVRSVLQNSTRFTSYLCSLSGLGGKMFFEIGKLE